MREITLNQRTTSGMPETAPQRVLLAAMRRQGKGKVYYTYRRLRDQVIVLSTTAKEMHLAIGMLGEDGLIALCEVLEAEHAHGDHAQFLFNFNDQTDLYALRSEEEGKIIYHLSPAFGNRPVSHGGGH